MCIANDLNVQEIAFIYNFCFSDLFAMDSVNITGLESRYINNCCNFVKSMLGQPLYNCEGTHFYKQQIHLMSCLNESENLLGT